MPSKREVAHGSPRTRPTNRGEGIELASVYLQLKTRVTPTWGVCVESDSYITDLGGDILLTQNDTDDEICVGKISAHSVHLGEAYEDGVPWFDVLDARSAGTAMYTDLIKAEHSLRAVADCAASSDGSSNPKILFAAAAQEIQN